VQEHTYVNGRDQNSPSRLLRQRVGIEANSEKINDGRESGDDSVATRKRESDLLSARSRLEGRERKDIPNPAVEVSGRGRKLL
jgi:hypothetical protein